MYLPRTLISHLYNHLICSNHAQSPPVILLVALEPDALCACRILTALLKRDYISHKIIPINGYGDLAHAGEAQIQPLRIQNGGSGGTVVCLGVGGLVDLASLLGLESEDDSEDPTGGIEVWVIDARRPWNLGNVFGGRPPDMPTAETNGDTRPNGGARQAEVNQGEIHQSYRGGKGGIIVFDDGDIGQDLVAEREAYFKLEDLPIIEEDRQDSQPSETESEGEHGREEGRRSTKRKSWSDADEDDEREFESGRPRQRRRSNSEDSIPVTPRRSRLSGSPSPSANIRNFPPPSPDSREEISPRLAQSQTRRNRRRLLRLRRKYEAVLHAYYSLGACYSEPISSLVYSLAGELGREDNDFLWHAIVGVSSLELYGRTMSGVGISAALEAGGSAGWGGARGESIRQVLRDEVRRLNPPAPGDTRGEVARGESSGVIPTTARSPNDNSIRLSPEPRFLLIRHWSLYDSMLHSPYLASRLHIWSDQGRKRLHKLLAKMGVSLVQSKQIYTHMDMDLKKGLRQRLLRYGPVYGLEGIVPPPAGNGLRREGWGFVRSWGWKACLSALDVGVIVGAILEVGKTGIHSMSTSNGWDRGRSEKQELADEEGNLEGEEFINRFWEAYDGLDNVEALKHALPMAQHLHRAILRTGSALISKKQIRHLRAFRMAVVKEGPDVMLFTHPGALTKLALWIGEAIAEQERESGKWGKATPLVLAGFNESRGVYIVVGTGGGGGVVDFAARKEREEKRATKVKRREERAAEKERRRKDKEARRAEAEEHADEEEESEEDEDTEGDDSDMEDDGMMLERGYGKNRFGLAFQEVVDETNARLRIDSFESCVVEVKKEDLSGFLEALSMKAVVG